MNDSTKNTTGIDLRYSVDESPPPLLSSMLAAQTVLLIVAGIVITPAIVMRSAEQTHVSPQLRINLRALGPKVEMEMTVAPVESNVKALIRAAKAEGPSSTGQLSLRILAGIAENIRHFQFHGLDFISLTLSTSLPSVRNRQLI